MAARAGAGAVPASAPVPLDARALGLLSLGHVAADTCQGAVAGLLPFLIAQRGLSYAEATSLVLAATLAASVVQPAFGVIADRRSWAWLMPAALLLAGGGLAAVGFLPSYPATFAVVVLSGLGVAAFHPEAARRAGGASGSHPATGMSLFSVGGNAGFALGPLLVIVLVGTLGLHGTLGLLAVPLIAATALVAGRGHLDGVAVAARRRARAGADRWAPFGRLSGAVALRSVVYFGLLAFVPLYVARTLGDGAAAGSAALTVMLVAGAIGTLIGGRVADRIGPRVMFAASMAALPPLLLVLLLVPGALLPALALIGAASVATFSVTVVIGQELLPSRPGVASGITLGLAMGIGGLGASLLGFLADADGIRAALATLVVLPIPALLLAISLPGRPTAPTGSAPTPTA